MKIIGDIIIVTEPISKIQIKEISEKRFGDMVKAVVDLERKMMALGGELHADEESTLLQEGSQQIHLWGINIYHGLPRESWVEFDSMINIRPSQGNRSRSVENADIQRAIISLVNQLIIE